MNNAQKVIAAAGLLVCAVAGFFTYQDLSVLIVVWIATLLATAGLMVLCSIRVSPVVARRAAIVSAWIVGLLALYFIVAAAAYYL